MRAHPLRWWASLPRGPGLARPLRALRAHLPVRQARGQGVGRARERGARRARREGAMRCGRDHLPLSVSPQGGRLQKREEHPGRVQGTVQL